MKKILVKVTGFWQPDQEMFMTMKDYGFGIAQWKNIEFTAGSKYDKLIILTRPFCKDMDYDERKAITFLTEPLASGNNQPHKTSFIAPLSLLGWTLTDKSRRMLTERGRRIKKTELLSSVISDLCYLDGHLARLQFIQAFDELVEGGFDLWGKNSSGNFFQTIKAYKGPIRDKFDALLKYKYHINCENSFDKNYYTEKLLDPILSETLCFYDGCTNIDSFIDERAYVKLDIRNIEASIDTIAKSINDNEWRNRIRYIRQQKERLLTDLNPLNIIWMAVNEMDIIKECSL